MAILVPVNRNRGILTSLITNIYSLNEAPAIIDDSSYYVFVALCIVVIVV
jgi:hypothetical protein